MNVIVKHDGTDISNWVVSYDREHEICTGIGTLELTVPNSISRTFHPWDVIEVWENGNKKAKFYVSNLENDDRAGTINMLCHDESKKLTDYFITDSYTIDYLSYSRTWIEKFLDEAKISYTFTVDADDDGVPLSNNTTLGFDSAFSTLTTLLQQTGWYIYFDEDGTAIIGDLNKDVNYPDHTITADDFTDFNRELDDDRLRNRAVVWGNTNPTYGEVFVDISVQTPWNYDAQDKRAVVIANSAIYSHSQALTLAQKLLNEFTQIKDEKYLLVLNDYNMKLGELLKVNSKHWSGRGLITRLQATMSQDGLVYGITLDIKCPRMFTFYSNLPPTVSGFYVYTGHVSDGIWRKHTLASTWYDDSSGLEAGAKVEDLFIRNGTFATVLDDGYLYTRTSEVSPWYKYSHGSLRDTEGNVYPESEIRAKACSINYNDNVIAGYNYVPSGAGVSGFLSAYPNTPDIAWVLELTGDRSLIKAEQVTTSGVVNYAIADLESTGEYNIVTTSGYLEQVYSDGYYGERSTQFTKQFDAPTNMETRHVEGDPNIFNPGVEDGEYVGSLSGCNARAESGVITDETVNEAYCFADDRFNVIDLDTYTTTVYYFTAPALWTFDGTYTVSYFLRKRTSTTFDLILVGTKWVVDEYQMSIVHGVYTLGDTTPAASVVAECHDDDHSYIYTFGIGLLGDVVFINYLNIKANKYRFNLLTYNCQTTVVSDYNYHDGTVIPGIPDYWWCAYAIPAGDHFIFAVYYITRGGSYPSANPLYFNVLGCTLSKYGTKTTIGPTLIDTYYTTQNTIYDTKVNDFTAPGNHVRARYVAADGHRFTTGYSMVQITWDNRRMSDLHDWRNKVMYSIGWVGFSPIIYGKREVLDVDIDSGGSFDNSDFSLIQGINDSSYGTYNWQGVGGGASTQNHGAYYVRYMYGSGKNYCIVTDTSLSNVLEGEVGSTTPFGTTFAFQNHMDTGSDYDGCFYINGGNYLWGINSAGQWKKQINRYNVWYKPYWLGNRFGMWTGTLQYFYRNPYAWDEYGISAKVLKHTSSPTISGFLASDSALEQTQGDFEIIAETNRTCKVDIANGTPTVVYSIPETIEGTSIHAASVTNEPGSFYSHADTKQVYESRTFNLISPETFPTYSGTFTEIDYERYVGVANYEGLLASEYTLTNPWTNMVAVASGVIVSGLITHFETSNFVPEGTYFFYTVSGVKSFFQKNPDEGYWRDYTAGLPDSPITIIRVDDMI